MRATRTAKPYFQVMRFLLIPACAVSLTGTALAQEDVAPKIDLSQFPANEVNDVVVPVPSEIFVVLDKLGTPNWRAEYVDTPAKPPADRARIAILLGTVIANGFVAVQAQDSERVKEIGKEVLRLAEAINVRKAVIGRSKSITEKADQKKWLAVREEFDGALQDVRSAMSELNDEALAQLVSLGGWIRGTQALTSIVQKGYSKEGAELLHQPRLIDYFSEQIDVMPSRLRKAELVSEIRKTLDQIKPLVGKEDGSKISPESVKRINALTTEIVNKITNPE